jgi:hypothetical protein
MNYFENANVNWKTWSPENVIFKSNRVVKNLLPSENILSYTSKGNRDTKMCQRTGGKSTSGGQYTYYSKENYKAVMVQLKDIKSDFPSANIDFIDWTDREDSVGNKKGSLDVLVYLHSYHQPWQFSRCSQTGNWVRKSTGKTAPLREGYRMSYGGQGDAHAMDFNEFHELVQITEAVRDFLMDRVIPSLQGQIINQNAEEEVLIG